MSDLKFSPHVEKLPNDLAPEAVFRHLAHLPHCLFLDSALKHSLLGRYSFVAADPFAFHRVDFPEGESLEPVRQQLNEWATPTIPGLPPFQGGAAGLLSYDLGRDFESIPLPKHDEFSLPVLSIGWYDVVVAFDHVEGRSWIISQGLPEVDAAKRKRLAAERAKWMRSIIENETQAIQVQELAPLEIASPHHCVSMDRNVYSNFTRDDYCDAVRRTIDYIHAGDAFQVNLSQRLLTPQETSPVELYQRLRQRNPATFAGYFDLGTHVIVSASPERFLSLRDGVAEARPIKGTRKRTAKPEADLFSADELKASEKDRAENIMIVDLMRNDMSRVCTDDSLKVTQLCEIENYQFVQHLVSAIEGKLRDDCNGIDLLQRAFPGGSITGAPKIRAMEIICELERVSRGAYCGSLGYIGFDGTMDWSILIRTITVGGGWCQFPVGGGIVAQSDPNAEYEETWHKAEGMMRAFVV